MSATPRPLSDRKGRVYTPAVGPKLRPLLWIILIGFALLGANGFYLSSVTALTWWQGTNQQTFFYMLMVVLHLALGFALILPFIAFGFGHLVTSWNRSNKSAIRFGIALLVCSLLVLLSGLVLVRLDFFQVRDPKIRSIGYWLHVIAPLLAIALYVKHRLAGPFIRWEWARRFGGVVAVFVLLMGMLHSQDPRTYGTKGPKEGKQYFQPSSAVTTTGKFIPADTLMMDSYCLKCHKDAYDGWFHSSHHFSSFNNKAYLASVRETRQVSLEREGDTKAARWCAGCHDPVPFFSGEFDDPNYDDVSSKSSQAGITCTACHAITHVNSTRGNADYTIEEPTHYPFASSENAILQWINNTLVKAKPEMHKKTFLKPAIKEAKFCSTCHKVNIPYAVNEYKDFLRGQNHWDTFLLSGVSGKGARSFYYPPVAKGQRINCHMNFIASSDFGAREFDDKPGREIHNHLFPAANTGLNTMLGDQTTTDVHAKYLKDAKVRIDLFGLRDGGKVDSPLIAPLRPETPIVQPGRSYLIETVVRTLGVGHPLSQGTVDSNEIWVELIVKSGEKIIGHSGGIDANGQVDPYSHFINVYMLDRNGKRIDRRNPQDIYVPLYNKQIPPGAGQVVHFGFEVPSALKGPIAIEAKVNYRKFDRKYFDFIYGPGKGPKLPVVVMASDRLSLPTAEGSKLENPPSPIKEVWQRWNDYGIGLFLEGTDKGGQKGELKQAEPIFQKVAELGKADGWVNLARVYQREGRIPDALAALEKAAGHKEPAAPWTINWLTGQINDRNNNLDDAIKNFEAVLATKVPARGFDFSEDYEVINSLGSTLYNRSRLEETGSPEQLAFLNKVVSTYRRTIAIDSENVVAHYGLGIAYSDLGRLEKALDPKDRAVTIVGEIGSGTLTDLAASIANPKAAFAARLIDTRKLTLAIAKFMQSPRPKLGSRMEPLYEVVEKLGGTFESESDPGLRSAEAVALETAHKVLHKLLKPDETAEGRAISIARRANPAANLNAQSIVVHPLQRPIAPGLDVKVAEASKPTPIADAVADPKTSQADEPNASKGGQE